MDPNETLRQIREVIADPSPSGWDIAATLYRMQQLDKWITNGGFLPSDWNGNA